MNRLTRSQQMAQAAFDKIHGRHNSLSKEAFKEYVSFAKKFPALIHTCGLAQAVAFALAKKEIDYTDDLAGVLTASGHTTSGNHSDFQSVTCNSALGAYLRLSRDAILAASWLKRYVEAQADDQEGNHASSPH